MSLKRTTLVAVGAIILSMSALPLEAQTHEAQHQVVEIATLKFANGITREQFQKEDKQMQATYMTKRPGFISREALPGKDGTWVAIVHWRSLADADASMKSFSSAPGTAKWMADIAPNSLVMNRYGW